MLEKLKFIVVEDKENDRREVLNKLAKAGFNAGNLLGTPETYEGAREMVSTQPDQVDVLFLDLNIPRSEDDYRPEKGHGHKLLEWIHEDINRRPGNHIRVVVVSGEDLLDGVADKIWLERYDGTLVSIAQKAALDVTLKASLKRLKKDPLLQRVKRAGLTILDEYECAFDHERSVTERLEAARRIAIQLVRNEVDHHAGDSELTERYADDLNGLIKFGIENRFDEDERGRRRIKASRMNTEDGWPGFLWRGALVQHLYAINSYRNLYTHIAEQPYESANQAAPIWEIPPEVLETANRGIAVGQILEAIVKELLNWYLPWHEQVYQPWKDGNHS
ncbi:MAG: response regulator [Candidatus Thiodiazotropha sp. (ex Ctena orbiculata)]|uniref:Response regulator n=1 Tax=Candidatus Thiodiazotropha taylori TaxID=2792791 RepID=A0A944MFA4_9GAMM|nr:response regulator [Candidatus Thiodiazotropha taylori]